MQELVDLRVDEDDALLYLPPSIGKVLNGSVRYIRTTYGSDDWNIVFEAHQRARKKGCFLVLGNSVMRRYSSSELESCPVLRLIPKNTFEPAGEECGTVYSDPDCPFCAHGRIQTTPLNLPASRIPKKVVARTIANEIIIQTTLAKQIEAAYPKQFKAGPVFKSGRGLNLALNEAYSQFIVVQSGVDISPRTEVGDSLVDREPTESRCPLGHNLGLNILTEVHVVASSYKGQDICLTNQTTGHHLGLLNQEPVIIVSQEFYQRFGRDLTGPCAFEVVHLD